MKVNLDKTVNVSDEQRVQIANVLDGKVTKRIATRDEMKQFIWRHGEDWEMTLGDLHSELTGSEDDEFDLEDLL